MALYPSTTVNDTPDSCLRYFKLPGKPGLRAMFPIILKFNIFNLFTCKFRIAVFRAITMPVFSNHILRIIQVTTGEKMLRPDAGWVIASVANNHPFWYRAISQLVRKPMCKVIPINPQASITSAVDFTLPKPAGLCFKDVGPKPPFRINPFGLVITRLATIFLAALIRIENLITKKTRAFFQSAHTARSAFSRALNTAIFNCVKTGSKGLIANGARLGYTHGASPTYTRGVMPRVVPATPGLFVFNYPQIIA